MTERTLTIRDLIIHPVLVPLARPLVTRVGRFDEVAKLAVFLVSDTNSYMTGETVIIDGGV